MTAHTPACAEQRDPIFLCDCGAVPFPATTTRPRYDGLPIGTPVLAWRGTRDGRALVTRTRSEPWTLPAGDRVVLVEGHAGAITLTHIEVLPPASTPTGVEYGVFLRHTGRPVGIHPTTRYATAHDDHAAWSEDGADVVLRYRFTGSWKDHP